jgi:hypothetical protein
MRGGATPSSAASGSGALLDGYSGGTEGPPPENYSSDRLCGFNRNSWRELALHWSQNKGFFIILIIVGASQGLMLFATLAIQYLFKDELHASPAKLAVAQGIIMLPWVIKPLYGFCSDTYPIFGYHRRPYLIFFGFLGCMCWILLALVGTT